jgi:hypothetical protein
MQKARTVQPIAKLKRWIIAVGVCGFAAANCQLPTANCSHKFHATIAQLEYNAKEQAVEAVIRFFADDFETAISQHAKREIKFNTPQALKDKANSDAVFSYVRERFELKGKNGNAVRLNWVGMEMQADMVWVYFEGKLPGGLSGAQMRNRLMQELFDDQVNIVNFKYDGKQTGTMFNAQDGFKVVPEKK